MIATSTNSLWERPYHLDKAPKAQIHPETLRYQGPQEVSCLWREVGETAHRRG